MDCDYCGLATGEPARWEVTTGAPGDGMTRYVCGAHRESAERLVAQVGPVELYPVNSFYLARRAAA